MNIPSAPSLVLDGKEATSLTLSWRQFADDRVDSYVFNWTYIGNCSEFSESLTANVGGSARQFVIRNLQEYSTYRVGVTAVNSAGQSEESTLTADTRSACMIVVIVVNEQLIS